MSSAVEKVVSELPPSTVPTSSPLALPPRLFVPVPREAGSRLIDVGANVTRGQRLVVSDDGTSHQPLAPGGGNQLLE